MFVKEMLFLLGYETLFAQNRDTEREIWQKKSAQMGWKWHVWETEIRSTIGLIFSDVTGCTQRARGRVYCIVVYCFPIQLIEMKIFISRKMEENTLELSFEVDVSEGNEEKDRNYSLDSDNDDGDLGDFDPEAGENQDAAVGGVPVQPAAYPWTGRAGPTLLDDDKSLYPRRNNISFTNIPNSA